MKTKLMFLLYVIKIIYPIFTKRVQCLKKKNANWNDQVKVICLLFSSSNSASGHVLLN